MKKSEPNAAAIMLFILLVVSVIFNWYQMQKIDALVDEMKGMEYISSINIAPTDSGEDSLFLR